MEYGLLGDRSADAGEHEEGWLDGVVGPDDLGIPCASDLEPAAPVLGGLF